MKARIVIDKARWAVRMADREISMPVKEFQVLLFLAEHPNRVVSRAELITLIDDSHGIVSERTIDTYIARLRKRLGTDGCTLIRTVPKVGYSIDVKGTLELAILSVSPSSE